MKVRTVLLMLALVAVAVFCALNWGAITSEATVNLGVATVQAPLGLVMLGLLILLTAVYVVFAISARTSGFFRERYAVGRMRAAQELADNVETSRFTELRALIGAEFRQHGERHSELMANVMARLDRIEENLHSTLNPS